MKVLMSPARMLKGRNNFIDIVVSGLESEGLEVSHWRPYRPGQTGDIFHIHWPETIPAFYARTGGTVIGPLCELNFWDTVQRVKRSKGAVVWTAHNITPHGLSEAACKRWEEFISRLLSELTGVIYLTRTSELAMKARYDVLKSVPAATVHHPHYGTAMPAPSGRDYRLEWGVKPEARVLAHIGLMSRIKGTLKLAEEFAKYSSPSDTLLLAGHADPDLEADLRQALNAAQGQCILKFGWLTDQEVVDLHAAVNTVCFFGENYLNSGTIMQALTMNRQVSALDTPWIEELRSHVGADWLKAVESSAPLPATLATNLPTGAAPDLSRFSPEAVARDHKFAYKQFLEANR